MCFSSSINSTQLSTLSTVDRWSRECSELAYLCLHWFSFSFAVPSAILPKTYSNAMMVVLNTRIKSITKETLQKGRWLLYNYVYTSEAILIQSQITLIIASSEICKQLHFRYLYDMTIYALSLTWFIHQEIKDGKQESWVWIPENAVLRVLVL